MTLIDKAHAAPRGDQRNYSHELVDAVEVLRSKGWGFRAIHQWLADEGQDINPNWVTFASAMCQRINHRRNKTNEPRTHLHRSRTYLHGTGQHPSGAQAQLVPLLEMASRHNVA